MGRKRYVLSFCFLRSVGITILLNTLSHLLVHVSGEFGRVFWRDLIEPSKHSKTGTIRYSPYNIQPSDNIVAKSDHLISRDIRTYDFSDWLTANLGMVTTESDDNVCCFLKVECNIIMTQLSDWLFP